jgi:nucleotide-binding universal stress UspA family protein
MNIVKPILARLEGRMDSDGLGERLLLLQGDVTTKVRASSTQPINLVVGYSGSEKSQVALDLTLWMAYQTRLATSRQIIVHVVYVIEPVQSVRQLLMSSLSETSEARGGATAIAQRPQTSHQARLATQVNADMDPRVAQLKAYEEADRVLWEARAFAEKWKGDLSTHLRFGQVAEELATVLDVEEADVLILGCTAANQPLIQSLKDCCSCPVVGIPN